MVVMLHVLWRLCLICDGGYRVVCSVLIGAVNVLSSQINQTTHNVINRDGKRHYYMLWLLGLNKCPTVSGRFDIKIPLFVVRELRLEELLEPILSRLKTIMNPRRTPLLRTHNIIFAPVGSDSQTWHFDDSRKQGTWLLTCRVSNMLPTGIAFSTT